MRKLSDQIDESSCKRRSFMKKITAGSAALVLGSRISPKILYAENADHGNGSVSFTTGTDRREMVYQVLNPFEKEIKESIKNKQVIIKPNMVVTNRPLAASHVDAIRGVLDFLKPIYNKQIIIGESTLSKDGTMTGYKNYGYLPLEKEYNVKFIDLNLQTTSPEWILDKNLYPVQIPIISTYLDPNNYFISITRLKTHDRVVATLGIKNMVMGSPLRDYNGRNYKSMMHPREPRWLNFNMFLIAQKIHPQLTVLDGVEGMEGNGPIGGSAVDHGVALASTDFVAADRIGAELMGIEVSDIGYLNFCANAGMGQIDRSKITIIGGKDPANFVKKYKLHENIESQLTWKGEFIR